MSAMIFKAKGGTVFQYFLNFSGDIRIVDAYETTSLSVPIEDFMEFAAHLAGMPPWDPATDAHDKQTEKMMCEHVQTCPRCTLARHCDEYWTLIVHRVKDKERGSVH